MPGRVVQSDTIGDAFQTLKARLISALHVLLILISRLDAELIVATNASKVGNAGVLLQEDFEGHLRPCAYLARKLKDVETRYNAYYQEVFGYSGSCSSSLEGVSTRL